MVPSFFENKKYWIHELSGINSNLPKNKITISSLLKQELKGFQLKDSFQSIPEEELTKFIQNFSVEMYDKILLPIVLLQQGDHFVTSGNKYSLWAVEVLMGHDLSLTNFIISIADYQPKYKYYYSYQVNRIRKIYPTLVQMIFSMS